jgi:flavin reductase (DIM6/NTAB) family NADH-FMN oxidoreductase RutF
MRFRMDDLSERDRYKLLTAAVTPRPIAWVTTLGADGRRNAAPYSFFNVMAAEPPLVVLGLMRRGDGSLKDTAANISQTGEFVVNLVGEHDLDAMNATCIDAPPDYDEISGAGIETLPSELVSPPRIASAPVSMECRLHQKIDAGPQATVVLGEVVVFHIKDRFIDAERLHVDTTGMALMARMHGSGWYARCTDLVERRRPDWP